MLEALRNATKSWVMKIILGALALTFVLFFGTDFGGSGGQSGGGSNASVLEVGDQNFTIHEVGREFNQEVQQVSQQTGQRLDTQTAINIGLLDRTISRMTSQSLFDQAAQEFGVAASTNAAADAIRSLPQFQDAAGRFSRVQFEASLQHQALSEGDFVNQVRLNLLRSQYVGTIQNAIIAPTSLRDLIHGRRGERRVAEIVTIPSGAMSSVPDPDEAQLSTFYQRYRNSFETPEVRSATVASLDTETLAKSVVISNEVINESYKSRINDFEVPETRNVVQASLKSLEDAESVLALIQDGKSLVEAAKEVSGLPLVNMGTVSRGDIALPELSDAAFVLSRNQISAPIESTLGWHLIKVSKIFPGRTITLSEARDNIRNELAREEAIDKIFDVLNDVEDGLAAGSAFDAVVRDSNMTALRLGNITRNGRLQGSASDSEPVLPLQLVSRLFEMEAPGTSEVVESQAGGFSVLRLDRIEAPRVPELSEVRTIAVDNWKNEHLRNIAGETAAKLAEQSRVGENLEALANDFGGSFERLPAFDRTGEGAAVPIELVNPLFEAALGDVVSLPVGAGAIVAKLIRIEAADPNDPKREEIAHAISGQIANDLVTQLSDALQANIPVEIDREALESAFTGQ